MQIPGSIAASGGLSGAYDNVIRAHGFWSARLQGWLVTLQRSGFALASSILALACGAAQAVAQSPDKTIKIVYPFPAGSAGDTLSRMAANALQLALGRTVIVENRAGAGGITGIRSVVGADPDGTTLLIVPSAPISLIPLYNPDAGYNASRDFKPISHLVSQDLALGVGPGLPAKSIKELIELVRKDPGKGSYGTPGAGSNLHLMGVKLAQVAKISLTPVHYRGAALALNDVIGGQLPMMFSPLPDQVEQHRAGSIRILATAGAARSTFLAGVPTFVESDIDIRAMGWFAAFAPAGLPTKVADDLSRILSAAVQTPENKAVLSRLGFVAVGSEPAQLVSLVARDVDYWAPIYKSSGFRQ